MSCQVSIDGATCSDGARPPASSGSSRCAGAASSSAPTLRFTNPKNLGPDQCAPVISRAIWVRERIALSLELEGVVENDDRMDSAMPFSDEPRAGLQARQRRLWRRRAACFGGIDGGRRPCETLPRPLRQPAEFEFLQTIRQGSHEQIAADARRLRAKEPSPFLAQRRAVEAPAVDRGATAGTGRTKTSPSPRRRRPRGRRPARRHGLAQRRSLCGLFAG